MSMFSAASPESPGSTSSSLLRRVIAHQSEAWEKLAHLYCPLVYRWARQRGLQDTEARDIVQEVFSTVAKKIHDFRRDKPGDSFRGWLWKITYHKLGDHFRRVETQPNATGGSDAYQQFQQLAEMPAEDSVNFCGFDADAGLVHRMLELIRPDFAETTWQAFSRLTIDGHPAADIAQDLGMTAKAVRQAKHRVLQRLRKEFEDLQNS
jgi:RNA polymerase sigma-70 factor (ECF subfamily)